MKQEKSYEINGIFIGYTHMSTFKGAVKYKIGGINCVSIRNTIC